MNIIIYSEDELNEGLNEHRCIVCGRNGFRASRTVKIHMARAHDLKRRRRGHYSVDTSKRLCGRHGA